uniref:Truncated RING finger protein 35 n=1 Tax=Mus musculus TaxID=10090 RepID=Q8K3L1_MOUSE|nr:truncated RING finger protein 35 [Mus musculus]
MELAAGLADLQAEARCSVCKEYLKNPGTMECGHKVCPSCTSVFWEDLKGSVPCPSCHLNCTGLATYLGAHFGLTSTLDMTTSL